VKEDPIDFLKRLTRKKYINTFIFHLCNLYFFFKWYCFVS